MLNNSCPYKKSIYYYFTPFLKKYTLKKYTEYIYKDMHQGEIVILLIVIVLLYVQPYAIIRFSNTPFGRFIFIGILVLASLYSSISGLLVALLIVLFAETIYEGMEGSVSSDLLTSMTHTNTTNVNSLENTSSGASIIGDTPGNLLGSANPNLKGNSASKITFSNIPSNANFKKNHCRSKPGSSIQIFVDEKGKEMKIDAIKKKYPINFMNGTECNPCDDTCSYTVTDSVEQIHNEENLRPKQSAFLF
jgi:hypothetical protein